ncbi:unnamed protein product [Orchesella dallaii]|uniref:Uncharacterized protein n=1 Tax=Orchesella dallaii TaxID=48710 RepID=A0ABP1QK40_9HEXA
MRNPVMDAVSAVDAKAWMNGEEFFKNEMETFLTPPVQPHPRTSGTIADLLQNNPPCESLEILSQSEEAEQIHVQTDEDYIELWIPCFASSATSSSVSIKTNLVQDHVRSFMLDYLHNPHQAG